MELIDLTGKKFSRLTVIRRDGYLPNGKQPTWMCLCECGRSIRVSGLALRSGSTQSCGCLRKERMITHGKSNHPLYQIWQAMRKRCGLIKGATDAHKNRYIDRRINVCKEWLEFMPFFEWAKDKWSKGLDIDRKDTNGNYSSDNCRFVTRKINNQNASHSKRWFIKDREYKSASDAAGALGVNPITIHHWCCGWKDRGRYYPPKKDCYAVNLY